MQFFIIITFSYNFLVLPLQAFSEIILQSENLIYLKAGLIGTTAEDFTIAFHFYFLINLQRCWLLAKSSQ